jgi:two-component system, NarL family, response regulator NreC
MPIHCLIVDDHTLFRAGLRRLLEAEPDFRVVGEARDATEALEKAKELLPDVVLMDIGMPGMSSFEAVRRLAVRCPDIRIVFLTMYEDEEYLRQSLTVGASGYLLKDAPALTLITALREVHQGRRSLSPQVLNKLGEGGRHSFRPHAMGRGPSLTPREREIVRMIAEGNSAREIAGRLQLSVKTVEAHKFNLMRKLGIHNKAQLVTYAFQKRIVKMPIGA